MYREWFPQIMYNHHQTGPAGTVMFAPPFRDPFNYNFDPLVADRHRPGRRGDAHALRRRRQAGRRRCASGSSYSTWWNGGLRTTAYFHNMIGLLTETIGNPTPMTIPFVPRQQLPRARPAVPDRAAGLALPPVDRLLDDRQLRGARPRVALAARTSSSTSTGWGRTRSSGATATTGRRRRREIAGALKRRSRAKRAAAAAAATAADARGGRRRTRTAPATRRSVHDSCCTIPQHARSARLHHPVRPAGLPDRDEVRQHAASRSASRCIARPRRSPSAARTIRPARTSSRPRRRSAPHVLDMFEPQDHPNDFAVSGRAADAAVRQRRLDARLPDGREVRSRPRRLRRAVRASHRPAKPAPGKVTRPGDGRLPADATRSNDAFIAVNRLLKAGEEVSSVRSRRSRGQRRVLHRRRSRRRAPRWRSWPRTRASASSGVAAAPSRSDAMKLQKLRIGLWDRYGGSMPSGWTRWLLEQFEFPFEVVFPQTLDAGNLTSKFDVLIFPSDRFRAGRRPWRRRWRRIRRSLPARRFRPSSAISSARSRRPADRAAAEEVPRGRRHDRRGRPSDGARRASWGCRSRTIWSSARPSGVARPLPREKYYVPDRSSRWPSTTRNPRRRRPGRSRGRVLRQQPGLPLEPDAALKGVRPVAWFDSTTPLRSGWA